MRTIRKSRKLWEACSMAAAAAFFHDPWLVPTNSMTLYTLSADTPVFAHTASENTSQLTAFPPLLLLYSRYRPRRQTALLFSFYYWVGVVYG